jgi:D-alanyl-lipoteichoic acid acyltransferase DltB (MBOAT superfamily)
MFFQTWTFAIFVLIFYPVYLAVKGTRLRTLWLLVASYVFYGWLSPVYVVWLVYATVVDYLMVLGMSRSRVKWPWLLGSVVNDIGMLALFKFVGPAAGLLGKAVAGVLNIPLAQLGVHFTVPDPGALLPAGMSFYIFQSLTYTIGCYRGKVERETSFLNYAAFVAMFPQLLMGPIERAGNLLPQLRRVPTISRQDIADGLSLFVVGMFKKVILADSLGKYVDNVYSVPASAEAPALLLATFAFAWHIYFDFSGYSDMARGVARALGIRLMLNFDNPYLATGLGDFWRRWHISLSTWFRDYVYIPLGGSRGGTFATYRNIFLTLVLSGLWHASGNCLIWGVLHGLGYVLTRRMEESAFYQQRVPRVLKTLWVFLFVSFAWIFFHTSSFAEAWLIITRIARFAWADPKFPLVFLGLVLAVWAYQWLHASPLRGLLNAAPVRVGIVVAILLCLAMFTPSGVRPFVYLQF